MLLLFFARKDLLMFQISPISSIYTIVYDNLYNSFTHHKSLVVFQMYVVCESKIM